MSGALIDLSHTVEHGMITYKGLPAPVISEFLSREQSRSRYAPGTQFSIGRIEMVGNTGTYIDSPYHRYADGVDLAGLALESLANLPGMVIRAAGVRSVGEDRFLKLDVRGKAVLFQTDWDMNWRTDRYSEGHPFLTEGAANQLVESGASLVGIDSFNIDDTAGGRRPIHSILLAAGIPIVEHLYGLRQLPDAGFRFFAVPVRVRAFSSFPVRAFAILD